MILSDEEVQERVQSPLNLLNRLRSVTSQANSPCMPPKASDLIPDLEDKIAIKDVRKQAAAIMSKALTELDSRLPEVHKPEKVAQIAAEMNKILMTRDEKDEKKIAQIIVYAPQIVQESTFETIVVNE